jgi:steroid delta-isomerase-like uncharacterized protein
MSAHNNKQLINDFVEFINTASIQLAQKIIRTDAVFHVPGQAEPMRRPNGYLAIIEMMRGGFPDIQWFLEDVVSEGDKFAGRFVMRGTHKGTFFGVPPSGQSIKVQAMNFYRVFNGQNIEEYGQPDMLALLQQIGAVPKV